MVSIIAKRLFAFKADVSGTILNTLGRSERIYCKAIAFLLFRESCAWQPTNHHKAG
jgi:hypothetical protein